ncbi:peptidoglycan bridge formation glycyltransferase FemA/FemB family protein [Candidatus Saccharibacteria bacterium]|nr:peptidoglycan bridge formation glycyltransferase FemA/FemB family protein [Candidatus Saccharibacteria bacterium]
MYQHFLQSSAWEIFEQSLGHQTFRIETPDFSYLTIKKPTKAGSYLFVPYGPCLKTGKTSKTGQPDPTQAEKSLQMTLESLLSLAKREKAIFARLEPTYAFSPEIMAKNGLIKTKDIDPAHTWLLDLSPAKEDLILGFSHGTRLGHNQFPRKHLSVEVSHDPADIQHLVRLQTALAHKKGITAYEADYLKNELRQPFASLYLVHLNTPDTQTDQIVAASLFFDDVANSTRYYMQSASDPTYKNLPTTVGLLCQSIFDAKAKGLKYFDFWGIAPDDAPADHPWAGFTRFKKSFGGFARTYSGTYDLVLSKPKYSLYKTLRKINRKIRKI